MCDLPYSGCADLARLGSVSNRNTDTHGHLYVLTGPAKSWLNTKACMFLEEWRDVNCIGCQTRPGDLVVPDSNVRQGKILYSWYLGFFFIKIFRKLLFNHSLKQESC